MTQELTQHHDTTDDGKPYGGVAYATGLAITWQKGPLVDPDTGERREPNGAFVDTVIRAAIGRLEHYESTEFACFENRAAIAYLNRALAELETRTARRTAAGVEGTWKVTP